MQCKNKINDDDYFECYSLFNLFQGSRNTLTFSIIITAARYLQKVILALWNAFIESVSCDFDNVISRKPLFSLCLY